MCCCVFFLIRFLFNILVGLYTLRSLVIFVYCNYESTKWHTLLCYYFHLLCFANIRPCLHICVCWVAWNQQQNVIADSKTTITTTFCSDCCSLFYNILKHIIPIKHSEEGIVHLSMPPVPRKALEGTHDLVIYVRSKTGRLKVYYPIGLHCVFVCL